MSDKRVKSGLNQAVRDNLALGENRRPWTEIATEHGVQLRSVYRRVAEQRARDIKLKKMANAANIGQLPALESNKSAPQPKISFEKLLIEAETSPVMSRDERLKVLSLLAKTAPDAVKVAAVAKLEEFERAAGSQFGPPPPSSREAVVNYLCELLDGIDLELVQEAISRVYTPAKPENTETAEDGAVDSSAGDVGGRTHGSGL